MKKQFKWLWYNMRGKHALYIIAMLCTVAANIMQLIVPVFSQNIVDLFISGGNAAYNIVHNRKLFYLLIIGMVGATFVRTAIVYGGNMLYENVSQHMIFNLRTTLFRNVENQSMEFYNRYRTGDLMTRLTGDLDAIRHMAAWVIRMIIECVVLFGVSAVYYFYLDPLMAVCLISLCPVILVLMLLFRKNVAPLHDELRQKLAVMNTAAQENISGNRVVKAFAREDYEMNKFDETNRDYSAVNKKTSFMWLKYYPFVEGCANGLSVIMLLAGGLFLITGRISAGEYVAFSGLTWTLSSPMRNIGSVLNEFQRFVSASEKVMEIYYAKPSMKEDEKTIDHPDRLKGKIQFEHVSFAYEDEKEVTVLKDISFTINPGETVAIMGDTGSGKTSLINLIPRFYDPDSGVIKIDDVDVKKYKFNQLRKNIGMATQDVLLYSDTIDGNIAYGNSKMSEKTVRDFAGVAAVTDFVAKMEDGFDTVVGERGVGLSGGQKQRISLARALAVKPAILILDDTTSAVDMETEKTIQNNLKNLDFECTKVIIAQRISSTKDADKIIIIRDGKITEMGTHDELLAGRGYYYDVYALQNGLDVGGV